MMRKLLAAGGYRLSYLDVIKIMQQINKKKDSDVQNMAFLIKSHSILKEVKFGYIKGALYNFFTGCKRIKSRVFDARNGSLQELT